MKKNQPTACQKCGTSLFLSGYCQDETCPFSDIQQDGTNPRQPVMLQINSDDHQFNFEIDAFEAFAQHARENSLDAFFQQLTDENFSCDIACDSLVYDMATLGHDTIKRDLNAMLAYCESSQVGQNPIGFSAYLDPEQVKQVVKSLRHAA